MAAGAGAARLAAEQRLRHTVRGARAAVRARRSGAGALPDFLVIGGMRCGTTSLFAYLADHPQVEPAIGKELQYFSVFYDKGERWYRSHFPTPRNHGQTFEASPYYLYYPLTASRVAASLPHARFIALLRDPVERAFSHYTHSVERGVEKLSFRDAVAAEPARLEPFGSGDLTSRAAHFALRSYSYVSRGRYAEQLARWYDHFAPEQVLVIKSESLYADPQATYARCLEFLGLPVHQPTEFAVHTRPKPSMADQRRAAEPTMRELRRSFAPLNEQVGQLLGWDETWPA